MHKVDAWSITHVGPGRYFVEKSNVLFVY